MIRPPFFDRGSDEPSRDPTSILRSFTSPAYSPRTQQADKRLLLGIQTRLARPDDAQMARPEIIDRSPVQILLDDGGTDVGSARNRRRIAEPLADGSHYCGDRALSLRRSLRRRAPRQSGRPDERAAPGTEILWCEFLAP